MRNFEVKCRCRDLEAVRRRAERLGARDAGLLVQEDRFFPAPEGRLKLRTFGDGTGELISYLRPDEAAARTSDYRIYPTEAPAALGEALEHALGSAGVVRKRRRLFLYRHTRIHLDEVEGLGSFVELETVLEGLPEEEGRRELEAVAAALGLGPEERVAPAYVDLIMEGG